MRNSVARGAVGSVTLLLLGCLLPLLIVEIILRATGYTPYFLNARAFEPSPSSDMVYELMPGFRGLYAGLPVSINSQGFRGDDVPGDFAKTAVRIAVIGDSVAFGQGVPDGKTLADDIAARLRARLQQPVFVANLGVPGYDTCQESAMFRERAARFDPQAVLLIYVDNDTDPPSIQVRDGVMVTPDIRTGLFGAAMGWLRKSSAAYNFVWAHWQVIKAHRVTVDEYRDILDRKFDDANPGWRRSESCLGDFAKLAKARSVRLIVVPFPELAGLEREPYAFEGYIQTVCGAARRYGAECADVVPALAKVNIPLRVSRIESHPSAAVYDRIAQHLDKILP